MNDIDEKMDGGRCDNFKAAFSFSQGGTKAKVRGVRRVGVGAG